MAENPELERWNAVHVPISFCLQKANAGKPSSKLVVLVLYICHYKRYLNCESMKKVNFKYFFSSTLLQLPWPCNTLAPSNLCFTWCWCCPVILGFEALIRLYVCFKVERVVSQLLYQNSTNLISAEILTHARAFRTVQWYQCILSDATSSGPPPISGSRRKKCNYLILF